MYLKCKKNFFLKQFNFFVVNEYGTTYKVTMESAWGATMDDKLNIYATNAYEDRTDPIVGYLAASAWGAFSGKSFTTASQSKTQTFELFTFFGG